MFYVFLSFLHSVFIRNTAISSSDSREGWSIGYLREKEAAWIRWYYIARILQIWSTAVGYEQ